MNKIFIRQISNPCVEFPLGYQIDFTPEPELLDYKLFFGWGVRENLSDELAEKIDAPFFAFRDEYVEDAVMRSQFLGVSTYVSGSQISLYRADDEAKKMAEIFKSITGKEFRIEYVYPEIR